MRVLLVEDNARLSKFIKKGLQTEGITVDAFGTSGEAEAALQTVSYNVVVLDLGLPDDDGLNLLCRLRDKGDNIPVLILTLPQAPRRDGAIKLECERRAPPSQTVSTYNRRPRY